MIDHHPRGVGIRCELHDIFVASRVNTAAVTLTLIGLNVLGELDGVINISGAVERHNDRELLSRKRMLGAPTGLWHNKKLGLFRDI